MITRKKRNYITNQIKTSPHAKDMIETGASCKSDAGLGGRLGLKGSDGQAEIARSRGAQDRSGPRMRAMLVDTLNYNQ